MYTFYPLAPIPVDHTGFMFVCVLALGVSVVVLFEHYCQQDNDWWPAYIAAALVLVVVSYFVSFVWTNQTPRTFANTPVTATLVSFKPEGYNITETSGKTTRHVDHHLMFVIYDVPGAGHVILEGVAGLTYPQTATLYKN